MFLKLGILDNLDSLILHVVYSLGIDANSYNNKNPLAQLSLVEELT